MEWPRNQHKISEQMKLTSTIQTDCWRGYNGVKALGFLAHLTMKNSYNFEDQDTGAHMNIQNHSGDHSAQGWPGIIFNREMGDLHISEYLWSKDCESWNGRSFSGIRPCGKESTEVHFSSYPLLTSSLLTTTSLLTHFTTFMLRAQPWEPGWLPSTLISSWGLWRRISWTQKTVNLTSGSGLLWTYGHDSLLFFLEHLNSHYPVQFTWTISPSHVTFLDIDIFVDKSGFHTSFHMKSTNHQLYLHFFQATYGTCICNHPSDFYSSTSNLTSAFVSHDYPCPLL